MDKARDWDRTRISSRPIEKQLTNAEEEYTILGIEKKLYTQAQQHSIPHRLIDHLCEAAFLLSEGLPPRLQHHEEAFSEVFANNKQSIRNSEGISLDLFQLRRDYYRFIAHYTQHEIDLISENRDN